MEFGGVYTSYIPTTTAAVTRNADDHDLVFNSDDFNPAMFSVYCEAKYNAGAFLGAAGTRYAFAIDNGTVNNVIGFSNNSGGRPWADHHPIRGHRTDARRGSAQQLRSDRSGSPGCGGGYRHLQ